MKIHVTMPQLMDFTNVEFNNLHDQNVVANKATHPLEQKQVELSKVMSEQRIREIETSGETMGMSESKIENKADSRNSTPWGIQKSEIRLRTHVRYQNVIKFRFLVIVMYGRRRILAIERGAVCENRKLGQEYANRNYHCSPNFDYSEMISMEFKSESAGGDCVRNTIFGNKWEIMA